MDGRRGRSIDGRRRWRSMNDRRRGKSVSERSKFLRKWRGWSRRRINNWGQRKERINLRGLMSGSRGGNRRRLRAGHILGHSPHESHMVLIYHLLS